tara:strand:- start:217 stop:447 length:231 start_codon:yes stop_codon:yes gene_type:complete
MEKHLTEIGNTEKLNLGDEIIVPNGVIEYLYLNDKGKIMYTSRNNPLKYENETDCIVITCTNEFDLDRVLDFMGLY